MPQGSYRHDAAALRGMGLACQAAIGLFVLTAAGLTALTVTAALAEMRSGVSLHLFTLPVYGAIIAAVWLPAAITLTVWVYRAHANLHADRLDGLRHAPPAAAAGLWVPLYNLYQPKGAMRQLWNHSHGEEPWFADQSVDRINAWWTCYVVGAVLIVLLPALALLDRFSNLAILTPPGTNTGGFAFASALLAAAGFLLIRIVGSITKAQQSVTAVGTTFA